jgi:hypothetical protein
MPRREYLTAEEIGISNGGPQYDNVKPEELFSATADAVLAARVREKNPRRYQELRREWQYRLGERRRPNQHYDGA